MKKYILAAALIGAFAAPSFAATSYYVMFNKATKSCSISTAAPSETEKFSMMGIYGSEANAKMAMAGMTECRH